MDEERAKQVMIYAQLDLVAAISYALGDRDTFEVKAAVKTLQELAVLTGDSHGKDLYYLLDKQGE